MPGVRVVSDGAFCGCKALTDVECSKLEIIGRSAFGTCKSLRSINLPSAKIVKQYAFRNCEALTNVKFGNKLERIEEGAFALCTSLRQINLPLKDNLITDDNIFTSCVNLEHVDLVGGIHETIAALQLEEWRNDMNEEIDSINQILPTARAGTGDGDNVGEKAMVIRSWIRSVLYKIIGYKEQHHRLLNEAATTLELAKLPKDIVVENVLPFLELPSCTFPAMPDSLLSLGMEVGTKIVHAVYSWWMRKECPVLKLNSLGQYWVGLTSCAALAKDGRHTTFFH
eukprot:scaffold10510_cov84-Skeletonema_dohrnii-CCMP3373.AAC.1